ncbi:MAG TPA: glycoside hydrolase family 16 protein [Candidatus Saccharimonadales bacterium]
MEPESGTLSSGTTSVSDTTASAGKAVKFPAPATTPTTPSGEAMPIGNLLGQLYGRYSIRFKATAAAGQGTAMIVWPSSDIWSDGEIDYPEGNFDDTIHVYHHPTPCDMDDIKPPNHCGSPDSLGTRASWYQWHTATTEWTPTAIRYYLDGRIIKTVTHDIPKTTHHWTLQVAPNGGNQPGKLEVD